MSIKGWQRGIRGFLKEISNANMFYKQIIFHKGIPFDVKLSVNRLLDLSNLSAAELSEEL